jgi:hypothetical protein
MLLRQQRASREATGRSRGVNDQVGSNFPQYLRISGSDLITKPMRWVRSDRSGYWGERAESPAGMRGVGARGSSWRTAGRAIRAGWGPRGRGGPVGARGTGRAGWGARDGAARPAVRGGRRRRPGLLLAYGRGQVCGSPAPIRNPLIRRRPRSGRRGPRNRLERTGVLMDITSHRYRTCVLITCMSQVARPAGSRSHSPPVTVTAALGTAGRDHAGGRIFRHNPARGQALPGRRSG